MEYLESSMETFVFWQFDLLEMVWCQQQISIVTLMQLSSVTVVLWEKNAIWNVQNIRYAKHVDCTEMYNSLYFT